MFLAILLSAFFSTGTNHAYEPSFFVEHVAPILASHCVACHKEPQPKGGLDLSSRARANQGGKSGQAIIKHNPKLSLLWQRVHDNEMPPEEPLNDEDKKILRKWILDGATWGTDHIDPFRYSTDSRAGADWWALQPVRNPPVPSVGHPKSVLNPIDAFVLRKLEPSGLQLSPQANPRSLIRRLYFGLIGLPPTPEEVSTFLSDPSEDAYREIMERLLQSAHYGERWGRHWLDVVRFGESSGFERNKERKNFWPYRDWVINAINSDMPYDKFVRMQLIGDQIKGATTEGLAAVGFLVAGVHNTVVGSSKRMKLLAREDELEEIVGAVGQTFLALTVNCARCHDHKFDPVLQREYYQLTSSLSGVFHGERDAIKSVNEQRVADLKAQVQRLTTELVVLERPAKTAILLRRRLPSATPRELPQAMARWEFEEDFLDSAGKLHAAPQNGAVVVDGALVLDGKQAYAKTNPVGVELSEKTLEAVVVLDDHQQRGGGVISVETPGGGAFDSIVFGEREPQRWMAGSEGFARTNSFQGPKESTNSQDPVHICIVYAGDGTIRAFRNGRPYGNEYSGTGPRKFSANSHVLFGLRHSPVDAGRIFKGKILRAQLFDFALSADQVATCAGVETDYVAEKELVAQLSGEQREKRQQLLQELTTTKNRLVLTQSKTQKMYTLVSKAAGPTRFLNRGDVEDVGDVVVPGAVRTVATRSAEFGLPADAPEVDRRKRLAAWITDPTNPLFSRVMVNRLWHYHFGIGIVETPSDFGFNGGRPSHPDLLDWLSTYFVNHGYSLKDMHRLIVTSATYRQGTRMMPSAHELDANNRLLWRKTPMRLDAEALRDTMLHISGKLNPKKGGPGFEDVSIKYHEGTTYYTPFDRDEPDLNRRTVYRFSPRGGRSSLLDTFDCPDPAQAAPRRTVTTTPLQSLSLLNSAFALRMSDSFAERVIEEVGHDVVKQVNRSFQLTYQRLPDPTEHRLSIDFAREHGLTSLTRVLFNSSEFVVLR